MRCKQNREIVGSHFSTAAAIARLRIVFMDRLTEWVLTSVSLLIAQ